MTAAYWVWKNSNVAYKGISHYRRRFLLSDTYINKVEYIYYDVILTMPRLVLPSVQVWFSQITSLSLEDINKICNLTISLYPEYKIHIKETLAGNLLYPNNMVIAKNEIYNQYCEWLFSILEELEVKPQFTEIRLKARYAAYAAELLTSIYFSFNVENLAVMYSEYLLEKA